MLLRCVEGGGPGGRSASRRRNTEIHCRQRAAVPRRGKAASVVTALAALGAQQCKFQFTDDKKTKSSRKLNLRC
jgi:hypothetical protein